MNTTYTVIADKTAFAIHANGSPLLTPDKRPLAAPTKALAEAIATEWTTTGKFIASKMPLTTLAYTAIDRIAEKRADIVEVLLVYIDTDTLSYRASGNERLASLQAAQWDPVIDWAAKHLGAKMQVTTGVMPIDQPPELHEAMAKFLSGLSDFQLAAACILSSGYSSLMLAIAATARHHKPDTAFKLSRLEEEFQAEQWGRDDEAEQRAARIKTEIMDAGRFLDLLERP